MMKLAKVIGKVWATVKDDKLSDYKLLRVQLQGPGADTGLVLVAADTLGAGTGETVLLAGGSSARADCNNKNIPVDASIIAIVDEKNKTPQEGKTCLMN